MHLAFLSLIGCLVRAGFTLVAVSWIRPGPGERDQSAKDDLQMGDPGCDNGDRGDHAA
jgi:hypothetical protein